MADGDLKSHALNSTTDFYTLLDVSETATEPEIRRAYRKTALKYHPDKVGANDAAALDKFHLLQIAYDVLSDSTVKELYDNARRARQAKAEREQAYAGRRRAMKEELERRESGAVKRKYEEVAAEEEFERELRRLAEDGKRRRREREEMLKKELQEKEQDGEGATVPAEAASQRNGEVAEMDRSVTLRFPQTAHTTTLDREEIVKRFSRFGTIEEAILRDKKIKIDGEKHRQPYTTAVLVYKSIVGAHSAVTDFANLAKSQPEAYDIFEGVGWAGGREPDCIPKPAGADAATPSSKPSRTFDDIVHATSTADPSTPPRERSTAEAGLRKVPSFGSFKGTPRSQAGVNSPSLDEITMIRLKNAERRRMEEKLRKEEEAAALAEGEV